MPSAWSESPPEMVADENGAGVAGHSGLSGRTARTSSYVPPHLRSRPHGAPATFTADSGAPGAPGVSKPTSGAGVLGSSGGARPAWGNPNAAVAPAPAWGGGDVRNASNGGGWGATPAVNHSASWGNVGGRNYGGGGRGWGGGRDREVNPFANDDPVPEAIFEQENTGINFDAYEDIPVETSGENVPRAVSTFAEIDLGAALNENIRRCKYVKPTPVQKHAIPISLGGRDLMACAQTGSGKTAAFCFPIIAGIMRNTPPGRPRGGRKALPLALILSPTRELSCQVRWPDFNEQLLKTFGLSRSCKVLSHYRTQEVGMHPGVQGLMLFLGVWVRVGCSRSEHSNCTKAECVCCLQIHDEAKKFAYQTGIRVVVAYGGAPVHNQVIAQVYLHLLT